MKTFKQQFKEEGKIFLNNFIMVSTILIGYDMILKSPNVLGILLGLLSLIFGIWIFVSNMKKIIEEFNIVYTPYLKQKIEELKNKKGEN